MDRYLIGTAASPSVTFTAGDTVADPGAVTVTVTREDGTAIVTGAATSGTGATPRTFALTSTHTASLDVLTLAWLSPSLGTLTTYVEVVGGFLFSLAEARALTALTNATNYPAALVVAARTLAESALEDVCGVAFVPRYARQRLDGSGSADVLLRPRPLSVTSATDTGVAVGDLTTLELYEDGRLYNPAYWTVGRHNVVVKYTHGYRFPPPRVSRACLLLAKRFLVDTPISDRATSLQNPDGTFQFFVTAGVRDAVFDVPECNAVINDYGVRFGVA